METDTTKPKPDKPTFAPPTYMDETVKNRSDIYHQDTVPFDVGFPCPEAFVAPDFDPAGADPEPAAFPEEP